MSGPYMALREAGAFGWLILGLFLLGIVPGLASLVLGVMALSGMRVRTYARITGGIALLVACFAFTFGGVGTMYGRKRVEQALGGIDVGPGQIARILREGYLEAHRSAEIGELLGGALFVMGIAGVLMALGDSKAPRPGEATSALESAGTKESGRTFGLVAAGAAVLGLVPLAAGATRPIPPPDLRPREDLDVVDAVYEALHSTYGCRRLEEALSQTPEGHSSGAVDRTRLDALAPDLQKALDRCTEQAGGFPGPTFCRFQPQVCAPKTSAGSVDAPLGGATVRSDTPTVGGRLPPEIIQRIVRQHMGPIKRCYERAKPGLSGRVNVRFVIDRSGKVVSVTDNGSDFPDPKVIQCTLQAFRTMEFPAPEGGIVTVTYPIVFTATE